jgi:hypothetical protein
MEEKSSLSATETLPSTVPLNGVKVHSEPVVGQYTEDRGVSHQRVGQSLDQGGAVILVEFGEDDRDGAGRTFSPPHLIGELGA